MSGIMDSIRDGIPIVYESLTKEKFDKILNSTFKNTEREFVIYTGYIGGILFDLAMLGLHISIPNYKYKTLGKYSKYEAFISIGDIKFIYKNGNTKIFANGHSNIKAYINRKEFNFDIYNGINYIFSTKNLDKAFFNKIKHLL